MEITEIQKLRAELELAQRKLGDTRENLAYEARMHVIRDTPIGDLANAVVEHDRISALVHRLGEKLAIAEQTWLHERLKS